MKTKLQTKTFKVASGRVVFGDPCYPTNPVYPAKNGIWTARVDMGDEGSWGNRVRKVTVHHVDFNPAEPNIRHLDEGFSVDSGQAGVFDSSVYGEDEFYELCCRETLSKEGWGYIDGGFATSSGYGDGWYEAHIQAVGGKAVCVELTFIE